MSDLHALEDWVGVLLAKLDAGQRRKLTQTIARDLRRSQQKRITAQKNPDGTAYAQRKPRQLREKTGRVRRKMFSKLRLAKHLKTSGSTGAASVSFMGRTARLARVHQYGLRDRPGRNSPPVEYASRELLGFTDADRELIRDRLLEHLVPG